MSAISDPISDMLTRLRNAAKAAHNDVALPHSKMREAIAGVLKQEGYIGGFSVDGEGTEKTLKVDLKYRSGNPVIAGLKRISKPSRRIYCGSGEIPRVLNGLGIVVLSTSQGVISGKEAKRRNLGGEILCHVW